LSVNFLHFFLGSLSFEKQVKMPSFSLPDGVEIIDSADPVGCSDGSSVMRIRCRTIDGHVVRFSVHFPASGGRPMFAQIISGCMNHQPVLVGISQGPCPCGAHGGGHDDHD
jgi:hypothetical protein